MTFRRSSAAVGLALVLAAGAVQAQQTTPEQPGARRGDIRGERGSGRQGPLLRGITLTEAQQQQLRAINQKYVAEGKPLRDAMRPVAQEARAARQRGDTAAARRAWQRMTDHRVRAMALQQRRTAEVRGILTAEQQRQFDTNRTELQARMNERGEKLRDGGRRGGRPGGRGARGQA